MKATLTFPDGHTINVDLWLDDNKPMYADYWPEYEQNFLNAFNSHTPPDGMKAVKCKIYRTGDRHTPRDIRELFHPPLFKDQLSQGHVGGNTIAANVSKQDFKPHRSGKKRTIRIW